MKRIVVSAMLLWIAAYAFGRTITVQNDDDALFYFSVISQQELSCADLDGQHAIEGVRARAGTMTYVPPLGARDQVSVPEEPALLLGYYVVPGAGRYPVCAVPVPSGPAGTVYHVSRAANVVATGGTGASIPAFNGDSGKEPILLDNRYEDWEPIPFLAGFSASYAPSRYKLEDPDGTRNRAIDHSLFWEKGGTRLDTVKARFSTHHLYLMFGSTSELTRGLSYYLYGFPGDRTGASRYTLQIAVDLPSGPVLLWERGKERPRVVGTYVRDTFYLEADVWLDRFGVTGPELASSSFSADLVSAFYGAKQYEEFFYTTLFLRNIPL